jgi:hypothetical protein
MATNVNAANYTGDTALILAAQYGHAATVSALITAGASVSAAGNNHETALERATRQGHASVVLILIEAEGIHRLHSRNRMLILAAAYDQIAVVKALLANGANVNAIGSTGKTALMLAAEYGHAAMASTLISADADLSVQDNNNETALIYAVNESDLDTVFSLLSAMPFHGVRAFQQHIPGLSKFSRLCIEAVFEIQREILNVIRTFRSIPVLSDTNGPVKIVLSNLTPEWYGHRFNNDIGFLSQRLMGVLSARRDNARAVTAQLALTASTSAISVSALTSNAVMTPVPSAVVPYTPAAETVTLRRSKRISENCTNRTNRTKRTKEQTDNDPSKKARPGYVR